MEDRMLASGDRLPHEMIKEALMPRSVTLYFDERSGLVYLEDGGVVYELEIGLDVTDEVSITHMEPMRTYDPTELESPRV